MKEFINTETEKFINNTNENFKLRIGRELSEMEKIMLRSGVQHGILIAGTALIGVSEIINIAGE